MAVKYLRFEELDEAQAQSRAKWTGRLGRPKRPEDLTEYLWGWYSPPGNPYYVLQIPDTDFGELSPAEQGDLLEPTDPIVTACFPKQWPHLS